MAQWEYQIVSETTDWGQIHQYLTTFGQDGWELVSFALQDDIQHHNGVFDRSSTQVLGGIFYMILKRPVTQ